MAEIGCGGQVPHGEDADHIPRDVGHQTYNEGGIGVGLVEVVIGDDESGGEIFEIDCQCAPKTNVGAREHVELGNPKRAIVEDFETASELVLNHFEFGFRIDEGAGSGAIFRRICIPDEQQG